jgi:hypothetical protein
MRPYLEKPFTRTGLVEWLKVKALSSILSTAKKRKVLTIVPEVAAVLTIVNRASAKKVLTLITYSDNSVTCSPNRN